jgi:hypothetical protein
LLRCQVFLAAAQTFIALSTLRISPKSGACSSECCWMA